MAVQKFIGIFAILNLVKISVAIYGFDCTGDLTNITAISLVEVGDCDIQPPVLNVTNKHVKLLQLNEFSSTRVLICSVRVNREITVCGNIASYSSRVQNGEITYYKELTREECANIQMTGEYTLGTTKITGIKRNGTTNTPVKFAGSTGVSGHCKGGGFTDKWGSWEDVVVQGWAEIILKDYYADVHIETNKIRLQSGLTCPLTMTTCTDYDGSMAFWDMLPPDTCGLKKYSVLYDGKVQIAHEAEENKVLYSVESEDYTFAFWKTGYLNTCGYKLIRTEHPRLFFLQEQVDEENIFNTGIATSNLDLFAYINSKFVYVEKHIKTQINNLYYDILKRECELERKVLNNALSIASISPDDFGYKLMNEPGILSLTVGEIIYTMKCAKVEVELRPTLDQCYEQLPVFRGKDEFFLAPRTKILLEKGTRIDCNQKLPPMYKVGDTWIKLAKSSPFTGEPKVLQPITKPFWNYTDAKTLATGGIYNQKDTKRLRNHIMMSLEKKAIMSNVLRGFSGAKVTDQGLSIEGFFDNDTLESLVEKTWNKMCSHLLTLGNVSSIFIACFMIIKLIKMMVDTIIRGHTLFLIFGVSFKLLGALFNSVTQLFVYMGRNMKEQGKEKDVEKDSAGNPEKNKNASE